MVAVILTNRCYVFTILLALWLAPPLSITGQAQTLNEYATVDSLAVGDTFDFSITLNRDQEYDDVIFPDTSHFTGAIEMRSRNHFRVASFKDSIYYKLQFFATADTVLPALPVHLVQKQDTITLYTDPVPIGFRTVLSEKDDTFRPLKPIFEFAAAWWPYILGFILLCVAAYFLYQYVTKEETPEDHEKPVFTPAPFVNPLEELRDAISTLENAHPATQEEFKAFYVELGDAIRRYFEELYDIPALESTSGEILQQLRARGIDRALVADTRAVLQEADMVKFAKFRPSDKQAHRALQKAHNFLERAHEIDESRIEQLQRRHQDKIEARREAFQQKQDEKEVRA